MPLPQGPFRWTNYRQFPDGSAIAKADGSGKFRAWWKDGTPLRSDNDETSYFDTTEEAIVALAEDEQGPNAKPLAPAKSAPPAGRLAEAVRAMIEWGDSMGGWNSKVGEELRAALAEHDAQAARV